MAVSKRLRFEVLKRDNHTCRYCGENAPDVHLTVDHVVPVALGGVDGPENLVAACRDCNAGKSSTNPDDPLVVTVSDDAARWAHAMELVARSRAAAREDADARYGAFLDYWRTWTYGQNRYFELPFNWKCSIDQFLNAGLEMDDLFELIDVAIETARSDEWSYFCGCCWRRIREAQDHARRILALEEEQAAKVTDGS